MFLSHCFENLRFWSLSNLNRDLLWKNKNVANQSEQRGNEMDDLDLLIVFEKHEKYGHANRLKGAIEWNLRHFSMFITPRDCHISE